MLEALRTDKVSRLWNSQGQVLGGGSTPRLLLMAPSDASTSHLDGCKLPLGVQDNHSPQNSEVTHKTKRSAGCSSVGVCLPCSPSAPLSRVRDGGWSGVGPGQRPQGKLGFRVQLLSQRQAPFLGLSLCRSVCTWPVCLMSRMH